MKALLFLMPLILIAFCTKPVYTQTPKQVLVSFCAEENKLYGYKDSLSGKEIIPAKYSWTSPRFVNGKAIVIKGDFDSAQFAGMPNRNYACINMAGKELFVKQCQIMGNFYENRAGIAMLDKFGYIDTLGKVIVPCKYESVENFIPGDKLALVWLNGKRGLIDITGKEIIPCKYDYFVDINKNLFGVFSGSLTDEGYPEYGKYGVIDRTGKIVLPLLYNGMAIKYGLILLQQNDKIGIADSTGKIISPCQNEWEPVFNDGIARVKSNGKWGYINTDGKLIAPFIYDKSFDFFAEPGVLVSVGVVVKDKKYGFIDNKGKIISPCVFDNYTGPEEGIYFVKKVGKYGCLNSTGLLIPCIYDSTFAFKDGLAIVQKAGKKGIVDKTGKLVLSVIYQQVTYNKKSEFKIKKDGKYGLLDKSGKEIIPCEYENEIDFSCGMARVKKNKLYGFLNEKGELLIPCKYDSASNFNLGLKANYANVRLGSETFKIDYSGNRIIEDTKSKSQSTASAKLTSSRLFKQDQCSMFFPGEPTISSVTSETYSKHYNASYVSGSMVYMFSYSIIQASVLEKFKNLDFMKLLRENIAKNSNAAISDVQPFKYKYIYNGTTYKMTLNNGYGLVKEINVQNKVYRIELLNTSRWPTMDELNDFYYGFETTH